MTTAGAGEQKIGLILSGGGARGFAHIGVLHAMERVGLHADVVAGTSIGAILGALYCAGHSAADIDRLAGETSWRDVFDLSLQTGLIKGDKLHGFLAELLPERFEDLDKPLAVATTDMESGEQLFIVSGDLIRAVRASSCFPGAFEPITLAGRTLADGGIVNNLPVNAVAFLDATFTIASDATAPRRAVMTGDEQRGNWWERMVATVRLERRNPMAQMVLRSVDIMQSMLTDIQYNLHPADVKIRHDMPHIRVESFREFEAIIALGEATAERTFREAGLLAAPRAAETEPAPRRATAETPDQPEAKPPGVGH